MTDFFELVLVIFDQVGWHQRVSISVADELVLSYISVVHGLVAIWVLTFFFTGEMSILGVAPFNVPAADIVSGGDEVLLALNWH